MTTLDEVSASKNEAIARAEAHASDGWMDSAIQAIFEVASCLQEFTTEEVWPYIEAQTHDNRAMGAAIRKAASLGYIKPTLRWRESSNPINHGRPQRLWLSLIVE